MRMKHITEFSNFIFEKLILEVGEGSAKPYRYTKSDNLAAEDDSAERTVLFKTEDGDQYAVRIQAFWADHYYARGVYGGPYFSVDFYVIPEDDGFGDGTQIVNKGRLFNVMATIVKATKEFMKDIDYKSKGIKTMKVEPSKSEGFDDHRRANLYMAYIKRQLPVSRIKYDGENIVAKLR